jgi:integrase/recombinase XerD
VSLHTLAYYRADLRNFLKWCDSQTIKQVEELTADHLRSWLLHLRETHNPGGTAGHWRAARSFINWYEQEVEPDNWKNPTKKVKAPRLVDEPLPAVSIEDVEALYRAASGKMAARDKAIVLMLADSGLRAAEILGLSMEDVDGLTGEIKVKHAKGSRFRVVFIGRRSRMALRAWTKTRGDVGSALWITSNEGTCLSYGGLRQVISRLSVKAGLPKPPPIHSFRRCYCLAMLRSGCDLLSLSRLMGHSSLLLLSRYAKQNTQDLAVAHAAHSPIDRGGR